MDASEHDTQPKDRSFTEPQHRQKNHDDRSVDGSQISLEKVTTSRTTRPDDQQYTAADTLSPHVSDTTFSQLEREPVARFPSPEVHSDQLLQNGHQKLQVDDNSIASCLQDEPYHHDTDINVLEHVETDMPQTNKVDPATMSRNLIPVSQALQAQNQNIVEISPWLIRRPDVESIDDIGCDFKFGPAKPKPGDMDARIDDSHPRVSSAALIKPYFNAYTFEAHDPADPLARSSASYDHACDAIQAEAGATDSMALQMAENRRLQPTHQILSSCHPVEDDSGEVKNKSRMSHNLPSFLSNEMIASKTPRNRKGALKPPFKSETRITKSSVVARRSWVNDDPHATLTASQETLVQMMPRSLRVRQQDVQSPKIHQLPSKLDLSFTSHHNARTEQRHPITQDPCFSASEVSPELADHRDLSRNEASIDRTVIEKDSTGTQDGEHVTSGRDEYTRSPLECMPTKDCFRGASVGRATSPGSRASSRSQFRSRRTVVQRPVRPESAHGQSQMHHVQHRSRHENANKVMKEKPISAAPKHNDINHSRSLLSESLASFLVEVQHLERKHMESGVLVEQLEKDQKMMYHKLQKFRPKENRCREALNGIIRSQKILQDEYENNQKDRATLASEMEHTTASMANKISALEKGQLKAKCTTKELEQTKMRLEIQEIEMKRVIERLQKELNDKDVIMHERDHLLVDLSRTEQLAGMFEQHVQGMEPNNASILSFLEKIQTNMIEKASEGSKALDEALKGFHESSNSINLKVDMLLGALNDSRQGERNFWPAIEKLMKETFASMKAKAQNDDSRALAETKANLFGDFKATLDQFRIEIDKKDGLTDRINELSVEKLRLSETSEYQQVNLSQLAIEVANLKEELSKCNSELMAKTDELHRLDASPRENATVMSKLQAAEESNSSLQEQLSSALQEATKANEGVYTLQRSAHAAQQRVQQLEREIADALSRVRNLEEDKKTIITECKKTTEKTNQNVAKLNATQKAESKKLARMELEPQIKALEGTLKITEDRYSESEVHLTQAREELSRSKQECADQVKIIYDLRSDLNAYKDRVIQQSISLSQIEHDMLRPDLLDENKYELKSILFQVNQMRKVIDMVQNESSTINSKFNSVNGHLKQHIKNQHELLRELTCLEQKQDRPDQDNVVARLAHILMHRGQTTRSGSVESWIRCLEGDSFDASKHTNSQKKGSGAPQTRAILATSTTSLQASSSHVTAREYDFEKHAYALAQNQGKVTWDLVPSDSHQVDCGKTQRKVANRNSSPLKQSCQATIANTMAMPSDQAEQHVQIYGAPQKAADMCSDIQASIGDQPCGVRTASQESVDLDPIAEFTTFSPNRAIVQPLSSKEPCSSTTKSNLESKSEVGGETTLLATSSQPRAQPNHRETMVVKSVLKRTSTAAVNAPHPASSAKITKDMTQHRPTTRQMSQSSQYNRIATSKGAATRQELMANADLSLSDIKHGITRMPTPRRNSKKRSASFVAHDIQSSHSLKKSRLSFDPRMSREVSDSQGVGFMLGLTDHD